MNNLYDVQCYFTKPIVIDGVNNKLKFSSSQSHDRNVILTTNNQLLVIKNGTLCSNGFDLDFTVDVTCWSTDGKFIAVADASGFVYILTKDAKVLLKKKVLDFDDVNYDSYLSVFASISFTFHEGLYTIALSSARGRIFVVSEVAFQSSTQDGTVKVTGGKELQIDALSTHEEGLICHIAFYNLSDRLLLTSGYGSNSLSLWKLSMHNSEGVSYDCRISAKKCSIRYLTGLDSFEGMTKMQQIHSFVFCLCNDGHLYQFALPHLILLNFWPTQSFVDFLVKMPINIINTKGVELCKIYGVYAKENQRTVGVYNYANMKEIFSTPCGSSASFVKAPNNSVDVLFVDVVADDANDDNSNKLRVSNLGETSPDSRLCVLLQQHKYEEALEFATTHKLDLQPVYQQQASNFLHTLSSQRNSTSAASAFNDFKQCVAKIDDALFVAELCLSCSLDDVTTVYDLLKLARSHLDSGGRPYRATVSNHATSYLHLSLEVDRLLDLLVTFRMTFGTHHGVLWQQFQSTELSTHVASLLCAGSLQTATIICSRHENLLISDLESGGEGQFQALLNIISDDVIVDDLVTWLESIIPAVLTSSIPNSVEVLTDWIYKRTLVLEEVSTEWPDDGIKLANVFFKVQKKLSSVGFVRDQLSSTFLLFNNKEELSLLKLLASRLQMLKTLRTRYHCNITLDELVKETTLTLTFRMLDKVSAPELVSKCLDNTVRPYMKEHRLDEDGTLLLYNKDLLESNSKQMHGQFRSIKERKVIAIIKCLKDEKAIVESTLLLAKRASIPWSAAMSELVEKAVKIAENGASTCADWDDDTKALFASWKSQFSYCINLEKIPSIASKYDVGVLPRGRLINHEHLVRRIVKEERDEAMSDAESIASIFSSKPKETAYLHRLFHLIDVQKVTECVEILSSQRDIAFVLAKRILSRTLIMLERTHEMWKDARSNHCAACIAMLEHIVQRPEELPAPCLDDDWLDDLRMIKNIYHLQIYYDELVSVEDYNDKQFRDAVLARNVLVYYSDTTATVSTESASLIHSQVIDYSNCDQSSSSFQSSKSFEAVDGSGDGRCQKKQAKTFALLLNLARLLQIPEESLLSQIALQAARKGQAQAAIDICKVFFLTDPSSDVVDTLEQIAATLLQLLENHTEAVYRLIPEVCELVSLAAVHCKDARLCDVTTLWSLCHLSRDVLLGTDLSTGDFLTKCAASGARTRADKYESGDWLHDWHVEADGIALDADTLLPLVSKILKQIFNSQGVSLASTQPISSKKHLDKLVKMVTELTVLLHDGHHLSSSLQWMSRMESVLASHLANHRSFFTSSCSSEKLPYVLSLMKFAYNEKKALIEALLDKVFFMPRPDLPLAVSLLLALPVEHAFKLLNSTWESNMKNFSKITAVSRVAVQLSTLKGDQTHRAKYDQLLLDATWCERLRGLKLTTDGYLLASVHWKQKFLNALLVHPEMTGALVRDFCRDYDLDTDAMLLRYVDALLCDDRATKTSGVQSPDSCLVQFTQLSALLPVGGGSKVANQSRGRSKKAEKCAKTWLEMKEELKWTSQNVRDKSALVVQLERNFRNDACPYDYERAEFLIALMQALSIEVGCGPNLPQENGFYEKAKLLLGYLRHVKREQAPSEIELQRRWCNDARIEPSTFSPPLAAREKLPLHALLYGDASMTWKIISTEASELSSEHFVPIVKLLSLNVDKLYMVATENALTKYKKQDNKSELKRQQLEKFQNLTDKMSSKKMAVAIAKRVAEALPVGQEKVDAYKWCLSLVLQWRDSLAEDSPDHAAATNAHQTLAWHCRHAGCKVALVRHGCDSDDANALVGQPNQLIIHLYRHPSIVARFHKPGDKYPDIHALVDDVCAIHELDCTKLRLTLIINLLLSENKSEQTTRDDDSTIDLQRMRSTAMLGDRVVSEEENDLIRLLYLLAHGDPIQQGRYLLKVIGNHQDRRVTNSCRVRALHCLFRIVDDDEKLFSLTNKTADQLRADLRVLIYLTELEEANFKVPASMLRQHDKTSVARSVIASSARQRNPAAVRAATEMCREFGSVSSETWIVLLQQLVTLQELEFEPKLFEGNVTYLTASQSRYINKTTSKSFTLKQIDITD